MKKVFYISLVGCLINKCIEVRALDENSVRAWAFDNLGKMWGSVYDQPHDMTIIGKERI